MTAARDFHVVLVNKWFGAGNPFSEVIETLRWGFDELGCTATAAVNHWRADARQVVLCPHLLTDATLASLAPATIAYNFEQIDPASQLTPARLAAFRDLCVWDYSRRNVEAWRAAGVDAVHMPVGWHPGLARIQPAPEQDIDVLFFGIANDRRRAALERIGSAGLKVVAAEMVFGRARDELIARAKAVVNIHHYACGIFESVRASYLLANGAALVSERASDDEIPAAYEDVVRWSAYGDLAAECRAVVDDAALRTRLREDGPAAMRGIPVVPLLQAALERSGGV